MEALLQDMAQAFRSLRRSPRFAWTAVLTLSLGIGAATAGFAILNWTVLRPVAGVRQPSRVGLVWFAARSSEGINPEGLDRVQWDSVRRASPAVEQLEGHEGQDRVYVSVGAGSPEAYNADFVSSGFLPALGTRVALGRQIAPDDVARGVVRPIAVVSDVLWHTVLGSRPDVIGSVIRVNGVAITVIGVAEAGFRGIERGTPADLWMPGGAYWDVRHFRPSTRPAELNYYEGVVRLANGATFTEAERQLTAAVSRIARSDTAHFRAGTAASVYPGLGLPALGRQGVDHQAWMILGIAALMVVVACANLANLFLLHRARRRADAVVRMVLGAGRQRLVRQFLVEGAAVGAAGGGVGAILALWLLTVFRGLPLINRMSIDGVGLDWRVLSFSFAAGVVTAVLAGAVPAAVGSRGDFGTELRRAGPTMTRHGTSILTGLAITQVAIAIALIAGAGLFARTLWNFNAVPLGFDPSGITLFDESPGSQGYTPERALTYRRELMQRVTDIPGVRQAAYVSLPPFLGISMGAGVSIPGAPAQERPSPVTDDEVSSSYFRTMGIPLLRGAGFEADDDERPDTAGPGKVIVSRALAQRFFGSSDPVGRSVTVDRRPLQVVGEVGDIHWESRGGGVEPMIYQPLGTGGPYEPTLLVKADLPPGQVEREVARIAAELDASLPIADRGTLESKVEATFSDRTILFRLLGLLSLVTMALATVGIYSLIAYGVVARTREFGIRIALGASGRRITGTAGRSAAVIIGVGLACGLLVTIGLSRLIAAQLYGVSRLDPVALGGAAMVIAGAAFLASWIPARRATRVDPMVALRAE